MPDQGTGSYRILKGEAAAIDLGTRGVLFALMGEREPWIAFLAIDPAHNKWGPNIDTMIQRYGYPPLVIFKDLEDANTIVSVDGRDLEKAFGEGVFLKSIAYVRTKDRVEFGQIDKWLPWLSGQKNSLAGKDIGVSGDRESTEQPKNRFPVGAFTKNMK
ncbi:MAG: hypothetical protein Q8K65_03245 [Alphaproteobacteria bacterium]|nr:hypothetical protein [Alphaproteobacteria bacterium]